MELEQRGNWAKKVLGIYIIASAKESEDKTDR